MHFLNIVQKGGFLYSLPCVLAGADEREIHRSSSLGIADSGRGYSPTTTDSTAYCAKGLVQSFETKTIWHSRSVINVTLHYVVINRFRTRVQRSFQFRGSWSLDSHRRGIGKAPQCVTQITELFWNTRYGFQVICSPGQNQGTKRR